jgi:hypothetical protein
MPDPPQEDAETHILEWPAVPQEPIAALHPPAAAPVHHDLSPVDAWRGLREASSVRGAHRQAMQRQAYRWSVPSLPIALVALVALHGALIGWRAEVVKVAPQTAPFYAAIGLPVNLRGLTFANVTTITQMHDGVPVLVVEGAIASTALHSVEVPRLRLSVRNGKGHEIYAWTDLPEQSVLAPREILAFRSRLASPPPDARDVMVRFFDRDDLVTSVQHAAAETTSRQ